MNLPDVQSNCLVYTLLNFSVCWVWLWCQLDNGDLCHIAWSLFYHQTSCRSTSRSKLRQYGESHVLLEEMAYMFRLALLLRIDGNTYHIGHSYGPPLWRNMGSWDSLHVASLFPFQLGRISSGNCKVAKTEMLWGRDKIGRSNQSYTTGNSRSQAKKE